MYYDGSIYQEALNNLGWLRPRASAAIRPLYLPLSRAVNVDGGIIPGGWQLAEECRGLQAARDQVLKWSRWDQEGVLLVHYGAVYGSAGLRVADVRDANVVTI